MSRRARLGLFVVSAAGLTALLLWAVAGLPDFGHYRGPYGTVLNRVAPDERHVTNVVSAVVFDYRGFDTLGEEFILFCAAMGVALLLRDVREEKGRRRDAVRSEALRLLGAAFAAVLLVLGLYVVAHGYVTPGGGFQGGVVVASAFALVYLAGDYRSYRRLTPTPAVDLAKGAGVGGFAVVGMASLLLGSAYLHNFGPLGTSGTLASGGSIPYLNVATALEVAAAFVLLFTEFLEELSVVRVPARERL
jgi:multicomponent Na+:H+ antiporter subunit B